MICLAAVALTTDLWLGAVVKTVQQPTFFPDHPIPYEVEVGKSVAKRKTATFSSLYMGDRANIGFWYDGMMSRDVEHIVWVSPRFVSRVLGYLSRREMWEEGEIERRWALLKPALEGHITFIVDLAALKKVSMADLTPEVPAHTLDIEKLKFSLEIGENTRRPLNIDIADQQKEREEPVASLSAAPISRLVHQKLSTRAVQLALWQVRDRKTLFRYRWWLDVPFGTLMTPSGESEAYDPMYPLGEYYGAWYIVQSVAAPGVYYSPRFKLRIQSPNKERVAEFDAARKPQMAKN